jgi:hypothetical protein
MLVLHGAPRDGLIKHSRSERELDEPIPELVG